MKRELISSLKGRTIATITELHSGYYKITFTDGTVIAVGVDSVFDAHGNHFANDLP